MPTTRKCSILNHDMRIHLLSVATLFCLTGAQARCAESAEEFFEKEVRPLLVARCYECHSGTRAEGGLSLETRGGWQRGGESGPAIVPGEPDASLLVNAINYRSLEMPPPDAGGKLTDEEIAVLTRWVAEGAIDPREDIAKLGGMTLDEARDWWAFQPLPHVESLLSSDDIDALIDAALAEQGLTPNAPADRRTLIRRATYDLTGLPPTPAEVEAFLADDSPDAFANIVERLLASPQYGEHWGRRWLDVVRYADTAGENTDRPLPHAWKYRNWVIDAVNADLPYDEFVRLQLAGDLLTADRGEEERNAGVIATGYLAVARRFGHDIDKDMHLTYEDVLDNCGKAFLGLTLGCARCHDHKYDPITSADYYSLAGIFASTRFPFSGCEFAGQPRDLVPLGDPVAMAEQNADYERRLSEYNALSANAAATAQRLKELSLTTTTVLSESPVGEGQTVALNSLEGRPALEHLPLRQGEVLQLVVLPNASHGADSTRVEWAITSTADSAKSWNVASLVEGFTSSRPILPDGDAYWCCLEATDGPAFLRDKRTNISGQPALTAWTLADLPSVFTNASPDPVTVWTQLPGHAFFMHPGAGRPVAVAWVCPADGEYVVTGLVADAHPAGDDGVAYRLELIASADYGAGLVRLADESQAGIDPPVQPSFPLAYAVSDATPVNLRVQERGDPEQLGDETSRRWLEVFGGEALPAETESGRRQLAEWIIRQPLFARVMVNRVWQGHFGRGLVASPNDFGSRGERPTHPELFHLLAARFVADGYSLKSLHRLMMNTAAYQRGGETSTEMLTRDPENRWLARYPRRRLTAEELRDSLLMMGGQLDLSQGQEHPFPAESTWTFTQHNPFAAVYDHNRRSVYLMVQRQRRHPYLALFDGADPSASTPARQTTTVPTQALYFLNDPKFHEQADSFAMRVLSAVPASRASSGADIEDARITTAFEISLQRQPTDVELRFAGELLKSAGGDERQRWASLARVLLASNEFLYVD
jgi:hypothetical protein